jgi:hypothetical protein
MEPNSAPQDAQAFITNIEGSTQRSSVSRTTGTQRASARTALGDEALAAAWAAGRAMTMEQAVEYALAGQAE